MATRKTPGILPCECGCGAATIRPEARFIPGHDAKLKSALIRTALGRVPKGKPQPSPAAKAAAAKRIHELGWDEHLAVSRRMDARKADQKARVGKPAAKPAVVVAKAKAAKKRVAKLAVPDHEKEIGDGRVPASVGTLAHAAPEPVPATA